MVDALDSGSSGAQSRAGSSPALGTSELLISKILAPAKINLNLFVLKKRKDNYHNIISLVDKVSIFDEIEIVATKNFRGNEVAFESVWEIPENNTIRKTLDIISELTGFSAKIVVRKNIPPGSGLAGASSDSAFTIKKIAEILKIPKPQQLKIAKKIGSDVPLFMKPGPVIIYGRGEKIKKVIINGRDKLRFVIMFPKIVSLTKDVYEKFDQIGLESENSKREKILKFMKEKIAEPKVPVISLDEFYEILGWNDLEKSFLLLFPEAKKIKNEIDKICKFYLTGSGSSIFSVFTDDQEAHNVYKFLKSKFEDRALIFLSEPVNF